MPKMKTHSGAKKRFRLTGTGKIMHERAGKRHLLERKSSRVTRRLTGDVEAKKTKYIFSKAHAWFEVREIDKWQE